MKIEIDINEQRFEMDIKGIADAKKEWRELSIMISRVAIDWLEDMKRKGKFKVVSDEGWVTTEGYGIMVDEDSVRVGGDTDE